MSWNLTPAGHSKFFRPFLFNVDAITKYQNLSSTYNIILIEFPFEETTYVRTSLNVTVVQWLGMSFFLKHNSQRPTNTQHSNSLGHLTLSTLERRWITLAAPPPTVFKNYFILHAKYEKSVSFLFHSSFIFCENLSAVGWAARQKCKIFEIPLVG